MVEEEGSCNVPGPSDNVICIGEMDTFPLLDRREKGGCLCMNRQIRHRQS